jgi:hypothetical protein
MKKILIIHPEGNLLNNPNLYAMVALLSENNFSLDYMAETVSELKKRTNLSNFGALSLKQCLMDFDLISRKGYCLIIGIDRGVIYAGKFANKLTIPYCYICYEINFGDEIGELKKREEIEACKNISFAICQDNVRSYWLSKENHIPQEIIFNVPVAGFSKSNYYKSKYLYETLRIPLEKKIALFLGSISKWTMIDKLVKQTELWPDNWVLVLHDRYGRVSHNFLNDLSEIKNKIYISKNVCDTPIELEKLVSSADVGIGLYQSNFSSIYEGKNLAFLGLSSGKLITYLQYGVPVITNEIGVFSDFVRKYKLGIVVNSVIEIDPSNIERLDNCRENCFQFFQNKLDFRLKSNQFLSLINDCINNKISVDIIKEYNKDQNIVFSESHIEEIKNYFNLARKIKKSNYYSLGSILLRPNYYFNKIANKLYKKIAP